MSVYQTFYVSKATPPLDSEGILNLVQAANIYNIKHDISGVLLYRAGAFAQLIEGEKSVVEALLQKIEKDPRHSHIIRVFSVEKQDRIFSHWAMGYHEVSDFDVNLVKEILSWNQLITDAQNVDDHLILHMLKRFETVLPKHSHKNPSSKPSRVKARFK